MVCVSPSRVSGSPASPGVFDILNRKRKTGSWNPTRNRSCPPVLWEINRAALRSEKQIPTDRTEVSQSGQFLRGPPALRPHTTPPSQRRKNAARLPSVNTSTEYSLARETSHQYSAEPGGHLRTGLVARTIETISETHDLGLFISVISGETPEAREATEDRSGTQYHV